MNEKTQGTTLLDILDDLTVEGTLYEKLPDNSVRCYACGHRCMIREGKRGICKVRFNQGGKLMVPWGYVAALQADPIEKKPFFHILPGTDALTFGMLGCDFHCSYCFTGDTIVITNCGPISLEEAFALAGHCEQQPDAEIAYPEDLHAVTSSGEMRRVRAVFKHRYHGQLSILHPYYLPPLRCTPDHRVYATADVHQAPSLTPAGQLTPNHYLAIPRQSHLSGDREMVDVLQTLRQHRVTHKVPWKMGQQMRDEIIAATKRGETSRQIGFSLGKDPSYIRHIRSKVGRGIANDEITTGPVVELGRLRFHKEHRPGIPVQIPLDARFARLLGFYAAEGSIIQSKKRPNSLVMNLSFSPEERPYALEVQKLLKDCLEVQSRLISRETTISATTAKASAAVLFQTLAGKGAAGKKVPEAIFHAPREVIEAYLEAIVAGDGHQYPNGKISVTTVSQKLAYGIAWLVLKLGYLPSLSESTIAEEGFIQGRKVRRSPQQFTIVWYKNPVITRSVVETEKFFLVPLRSIETAEFHGDVYNMEVEEEHNYLAGFFLVSNCQNWVTSQAGRDPVSEMSVESIRRTSPEELVEIARRAGAGVVASSYNEPLITSEWAVDVFRQANQAGLRCVYISNGNLTSEVLEVLRPYIVGYKIDLKTMNDKHYRHLGGVLENVLEGIRLVHASGLWVEVVTLVIPGFNDSNEELMDAARYITSVSPNIPWHVTAFHPDYKMTDPPPTTVSTLLRAAEIGQEAGLNFVYAGNIPGRVGEYENTMCPKCRTTLIERYSYVIRSYKITAEGKCPQCGYAVPGIWHENPGATRLDGPGFPRAVIRR